MLVFGSWLRFAKYLLFFIKMRSPTRTKTSPSYFRATMPSSLSRTTAHNFLNLEEGVQGTHATPVTSPTVYSFFVRVSEKDLQEQRNIYEWRMINCAGLVEVCGIKLQSYGNVYNSNLLLKVDMPVSKSNFSQIKEISLTKCVGYLQSAIKAILTMLQYFYPITFTEKMMYLTEKGVKVWMDQRFYMNPNNTLYTNYAREVPMKESVKSVVRIFEGKCLKTKLSHQLFSSLQQAVDFGDAFRMLSIFQKQENLFPIEREKIKSIGTPATSQFNLEFSVKKCSKKKKMSEKQIKSQAVLKTPLKFIQHKGQGYMHQSQHNKCRKTRELTENTCFSPSKNSTSIALSEMRQSFPSTLKKQDETCMTGLSNISPTSLPLESRSWPMEDNFDEKKGIFESMLTRNGWSPNITSLMEGVDMKKSITHGKQEKALWNGRELKKLHLISPGLHESQNWESNPHQ